MTNTMLEQFQKVETEVARLGAMIEGKAEATQTDTPVYKPGTLEAVGDPEGGWSYPWPPAGEESVYTTFQHFRDEGGERFGVGMAQPAEYYGSMREYAVVHEVSPSGGLNALVVLAAADDYEDTGEMLGLIKGKGPGGRAMYRPGDTLPREYRKAPVVPFKDRVTGPYARDGLAIVIAGTNQKMMLQHALIQRHLRGRG